MFKLRFDFDFKLESSLVQSTLIKGETCDQITTWNHKQ